MKGKTSPDKPKKVRGKNGGVRPGAGRPKGSKSARTIRRQLEEDMLIKLLKTELQPIVHAQIANAKGIKYLVVRERKGGKFVTVTEAMARSAKAGKLGKDEEIIEVWEKDPSVHAFSLMLDRAYGKAKESKQELEVTVKPYKWGDE